MKLTPHFGKLLSPHDLLMPSLDVDWDLDVDVARDMDQATRIVRKASRNHLSRPLPATGAGTTHTDKPSGLGSHSSRVGVQPSGIRMTTTLDSDTGTHLYVNKDPPKETHTPATPDNRVKNNGQNSAPRPALRSWMEDRPLYGRGR
jgi:hypothetical protein